MAARPYQVHAGMTAKLKASAAVTALVSTRIYDRPPQNVTLPYIQITPDLGDAYDGTGMDGWEQIMRVDVWTREGGRSGTASNIAAATFGALHNQDLTLSAGSFVNGRLIPGGQQTIRDDDTETVHVVQRFRYVTQD